MLGSTKGIVYVLTNPAMEGYIKVGKTKNLEERLRGLDNTSVPLPFHCIFAMEVDDYERIEKLLHATFASKRTRSRREFFEIDVAEAIAALQISNGRDVTPGQDYSGSPEEDAESNEAVKRHTKRRGRFRFSTANLIIGAIINYIYDKDKVAEVISDSTILFEGEELTLSAAAAKIQGKLHEDGRPNSEGVQGPIYWEFDGKTLDHRRRRFEEEEGED